MQKQTHFNWYYSRKSLLSTVRLTSNVGELVLQGADVSYVDVEEGAKLGHDHAYTGDGDVCQATAAVNWQRGQGGHSQNLVHQN